MDTVSERQRIDKWLFFARVVKSRSLAAKIVQGGHVRINTVKSHSASHPVKAEDVLTITLQRRILVLRIVALGSRRGPYSEAQELYEDLSPPTEPASAPSEGQHVRLHGRPGKKERREALKLLGKTS